LIVGTGYSSVINSGSVNSFENGLDCTRKATMGFFMD